MQPTNHRFTTIEAAKEYALAGNATLTLESLRTGTHFTYKVSAPKEVTPRGGKVTDYDSDIRFVSLLRDGNADTGSFTYLGLVNKDGEFRLTKASRATLDAPSVKAFRYFLTVTQLPEQLVVRHENKCGRCGKTLTHPESIDLGIGPECQKHFLNDVEIDL